MILINLKKIGLTFSFLLFLLLAVGCSEQDKVFELSGTTAERVAGVARVIERNTKLPSVIDDARLIELQFGDNTVGPADFRSYLWIKVSSNNIKKWKSVLKNPPHDTPIFDIPSSQPTWWLKQDEFEELGKFDTFEIFQRHGWIGIDSDGNIFARTYTM